MAKENRSPYSNNDIKQFFFWLNSKEVMVWRVYWVVAGLPWDRYLHRTKNCNDISGIARFCYKGVDIVWFFVDDDAKLTLKGAFFEYFSFDLVGPIIFNRTKNSFVKGLSFFTRYVRGDSKTYKSFFQNLFECFIKRF